MKPKVSLEKDIIDKYMKYENKTTKFKAYKMNQQLFDIDQNYQPQAIMGEGAYGMVVAALDSSKNQMVAIKKIIKPFEHNMFSRRTLRELKLLRLVKHPNIMAVKTVLLPKSRENFEDIYVVSELMETDLMTLIKSDQELTEDHWKFFMFQILEGLNCLHKSNVIHRDLKPRNLLVNKDCDVKICDFGLARVIDPKMFMSSSYVATRWYRAPELLLGHSKYTTAVDMWSAGVIFAQLILRRPFLPGYNTRDQVQKIYNFFGHDSLDVIEQISEQGKQIIKSLPLNKQAIPFDKIFAKVSQTGLSLLKKLLEVDHKKRITAEQALCHPWFKDFEYEKVDFEPIDLKQFEFELFDFTVQQLKDAIYEQILLYHSKDFMKQYQDKKKRNQGLYKWILQNSNSKLKDDEN